MTLPLDGVALVVVDLPRCINARTLAIQPWALKVLRLLGNTRTEILPGGTLRVIAFVKRLPEHLLASPGLPLAGNTDGRQVPVHVFALGPKGYIGLTGRLVEGTVEEPLVLDDIDAVVEALRVSVAADDGRRPSDVEQDLLRIVRALIGLGSIRRKELIAVAVGMRNGKARMLFSLGLTRGLIENRGTRARPCYAVTEAGRRLSAPSVDAMLGVEEGP
jgi:hypothetical protein